MKTRILYVDDETINLLNMRFALEEEFEVHTALSAEKALDVVESFTVDVVLTDQKMRGMSGVELAEALRERGLQVPVVIVTGYLNDAAVNAALEAGLVNDVIYKPYTHERFVDAVRRQT